MKFDPEGKYAPKKNTFLHVESPGLGEMEPGVVKGSPSTEESIYNSFKTKEFSEPFFKKHQTTQEEIFDSFKRGPVNNITGASIKKKPDTDFGSIVEKQIQEAKKIEEKNIREEVVEKILE